MKRGFAISGQSELFEGNADALDALRERAWQAMQPDYLQRLAGRVESTGPAAATCPFR